MLINFLSVLLSRRETITILFSTCEKGEYILLFLGRINYNKTSIIVSTTNGYNQLQYKLSIGHHQQGPPCSSHATTTIHASRRRHVCRLANLGAEKNEAGRVETAVVRARVLPPPHPKHRLAPPASRLPAWREY